MSPSLSAASSSFIVSVLLWSPRTFSWSNLRVAAVSLCTISRSLCRSRSFPGSSESETRFLEPGLRQRGMACVNTNVLSRVRRRTLAFNGESTWCCSALDHSFSVVVLLVSGSDVRCGQYGMKRERRHMAFHSELPCTPMDFRTVFASYRAVGGEETQDEVLHRVWFRWQPRMSAFTLLSRVPHRCGSSCRFSTVGELCVQRDFPASFRHSPWYVRVAVVCSLS